MMNFSNNDMPLRRRGSMIRGLSVFAAAICGLSTGAFAQAAGEQVAESGRPTTMTIVNGEVGALRSVDGGRTWQVVPAASAERLQSRLAGKLSAGYQGVEVGFTGRTDVYPNPAVDRVSIRYELGAPGEVNVALHDIHGREVLRAFEGPRAAGEHSLSLEIGSLPSGIYQYRIVSSGLIVAGSTMVVAR